MIIPPKAPTFELYRKICRSRESISRFLMNIALTGVELRGSVLDVGGIPNSKKDYKSLFRGYDSWMTLNVNPEYAPDFVVDCNNRLPFKDAEFDNIVSVSTLEHIRNVNLILSEIVRITKPGGKIIICVPFIFGVHGDPDDFNRQTASWYQNTLSSLNISKDNQIIYPLCWDVFSTGMSLIDNGLSPFWRKVWRPLFLLPGVLFGGKAEKKIDEKLSTPLAHIIMVTK